ncbi:MAG: beta-galactosidase [Candidatus Saccharibacteria bacterium]|nr:beta-galactosidase [Candidatus Saccharibacteria bacterium]
MSKWGVTVNYPTPVGPLVRGWKLGKPAVRTGWDSARVVASFTDPNPGQYRSRIGMNAAPSLQNMQELTAAGITWLRCDFAWPAIQPTSSGQFTWTAHDAIMTSAAKTGMNILAILDYCAPWASTKGAQAGDIRFFAPSNNADYAAFCTAVIQRYGPGGSFWSANLGLRPSPVTAVEIWNEPWLSFYWNPEPDPTGYASLALVAAQAVKAASAAVKVIIPGDLFQSRADGLTQQRWGSAVFAAQPTLKNYTDAISVHPYPSSVCPDPLDDTRNVDQGWYGKCLEARDQIALTTGTLLPVWITECGWTTATGASNGVTESAAATYMNHMLGRALQSNGKSTSYRPIIEKVFPFKYEPANGVMTDAEGNYGMLHTDGTPKPAWLEVLKYL